MATPAGTLLSRNNILAKKVQSQLAGSDAVLIKSIMDLSGEAEIGDDRVTIPRMSGLTLKSITQGTRAVGDVYNTDGDALLLNQSKEVSTYFGYTDEANSTVNRQDQFFMGAPRIYAQGIELLIAAQLEVSGPNDFASSESGAATPVGEFTFNIKDIAKAKRLLDAQKVSKIDRWLALNAAGMEVLASTQEFQDGSKSLSAEALKMGVVSQVKGFNVIQSEDVSDGKINCYHREAVAFAIHKQMNSVVKDIEEFSEVYVALKGKYGSKLLDGGKRKVTISMTAGTKV